MKNSEFEDSGEMIFGDLKTLNSVRIMSQVLDIQSNSFNVFGIGLCRKIVIVKNFITMSCKGRGHVNKTYICKKLK